MFSVRWIQHAVGHGGFHTGHFEADDGRSFHWAFDCGARRTAKFDAYLKAWARRHPCALDWLFLSHFDTDHVSGLSTLMSHVAVDKVMLPYLNDREFAYLLLHEVARGTLNQELVEAIADPTGFFAARGAAEVVFLRGEEPGDDPEAIGEEPRDPETGRGWFEHMKPARTPLRGSRSIAATGGGCAASEVKNGTCEIWLDGHSFGLRLKPYRAPTHRYALRGIVKAIEALVGAATIGPIQPGLGALAYAVARHARTAAGRAGLREIYKQFVGSSNRASLSLLSIPIAHDESQGHWWLNRPDPWQDAQFDTPAWLNTGDAELLKPADLSSWENCYAPDLPRVKVLALPHHGSDKNSDAAFQQLCPDAALAAHVRSSSKKHPGAMVITHAGSRLKLITEESGTALELHYRGW